MEFDQILLELLDVHDRRWLLHIDIWWVILFVFVSLDSNEVLFVSSCLLSRSRARVLEMQMIWMWHSD